MTTEKLESITARIRKLLALSKSPNEHEAASAAAAAAKLQAEYQIEQATLEDSGQAFTAEDIEDLGIDGGDYRVNGTWKSQVIAGVSTLNGCRFYTHGNMFQIHGRKSAVQTVSYTAQYLWTEIEAITKRAWAKKAGRVAESAHVWCESFRFGCAKRIRQRLEELATAAQTERAALMAAGNRALVVLARHDAEVKAAWDDLYKRLGLRKLSARQSRVSVDAYNAGHRSGDSVALGGSRRALGPGAARIADR